MFLSLGMLSDNSPPAYPLIHSWGSHQQVVNEEHSAMWGTAWRGWEEKDGNIYSLGIRTL